MQRSDDFVGVNRRQNESGVLRGGTFFLGNHPLKVVVITVRTTTFCACVQNEHDHILWVVSNQSIRTVGFTRKIPLYVKFVKRVLENLWQ